MLMYLIDYSTCLTACDGITYGIFCGKWVPSHFIALIVNLYEDGPSMIRVNDVNRKKLCAKDVSYHIICLTSMESIS